MPKKTARIAYLYVALVILIWGAVPTIAKLLLYNLSNIQVFLFSSLFATITLFCVVLAQGKMRIIKKYTYRDYAFFAAMGFIGIFLYYIPFYTALQLASAQEAFIINYTWPIWVLVLAVLLLKESMNAKKMIAIGLGFVGIYLVATGGSSGTFSASHITGDMFALLGAFCYALFSILGKKYEYDRLTSIMFYFMFAFFFTLIAVLLFSSIPQLNLYQLGGIILLGFFSQATANLLWFLALKKGDTAVMSNLIFLTPFVSLIYIFFILHESILVTSVAGLVLIVLGILIQRLKAK